MIQCLERRFHVGMDWHVPFVGGGTVRGAVRGGSELIDEIGETISTVTFTVSRRKALSMGHTIEEIEKIMNEHVDKLNKLLELGLPMQQRPTKGELRRLASKDASEFRKKTPIFSQIEDGTQGMYLIRLGLVYRNPLVDTNQCPNG